MFDVSKAQSLVRRCITILERHIKVPLFDCSMCGQCVVRSLALTCPMQCPKQMRNGPCGGTMNGMCEVFPDRPCVWVVIYERLEKKSDGEKLEELLPPVGWRLWGTSAWCNLLEKRINGRGFARSDRVTEEWHEERRR